MAGLPPPRPFASWRFARVSSIDAPISRRGFRIFFIPDINSSLDGAAPSDDEHVVDESRAAHQDSVEATSASDPLADCGLDLGVVDVVNPVDRLHRIAEHNGLAVYVERDWLQVLRRGECMAAAPRGSHRVI